MQPDQGKHLVLSECIEGFGQERVPKGHSRAVLIVLDYLERTLHRLLSRYYTDPYEAVIGL